MANFQRVLITGDSRFAGQVLEVRFHETKALDRDGNEFGRGEITPVGPEDISVTANMSGFENVTVIARPGAILRFAADGRCLVLFTSPRHRTNGLGVDFRVQPDGTLVRDFF